MNKQIALMWLGQQSDEQLLRSLRELLPALEARRLELLAQAVAQEQARRAQTGGAVSRLDAFLQRAGR